MFGKLPISVCSIFSPKLFSEKKLSLESETVKRWQKGPLICAEITNHRTGELWEWRPQGGSSTKRGRCESKRKLPFSRVVSLARRRIAEARFTRSRKFKFNLKACHLVSICGASDHAPSSKTFEISLTQKATSILFWPSRPDCVLQTP